MTYQAVYGISKSHVPTESRPGHVAIFAGFFEDVSAIFRGWKHNPIKFDNIFNQTKRAWLFGSPDIVLMFSEELKHATSFHYSPAEEQFFDEDASGLDRWVFDKVKSLFANKTEGLEDQKSIFFLHLLGIDSNGHGNKPNSPQYLNNIKTVDDGIKDIVNLFENHFNDGKTSYLFTSDHGMTDFGAHGAGEDDETLTPLVLWGAGVRPLPSIQIINQIDLTPLQAALLNLPIPTNNFGVLPLNFLNTSNKYKFQASCANLKQMVEQYGLKRTEKLANSLPFTFKEYPDFPASTLNRVEETVSQLASKKRYDMAANNCLEWIPRVRKAFLFFHRYHRKTLGIAISSVFILWTTFLYLFFSRPQFHFNSKFWIPSHVFNSIIFIELLLSLYQRWPIMHLIYVILPVYLVSLIKNLLNLTLKSSINSAFNFYHQLNGQFFGYFIGLGILMFAFISAFFNRAIVSLILIFMAPLPYLMTKSTKWSKLWIISCLLLAIFPQMEAVGRTPFISLTIISPLLASICLYYYKTKHSRSSSSLFNYFILLNILTSLVNFYSHFYWSYFSKTPLEVKLFSWFSITFNLIVPLFADSYLCDRIILWMAAINIPFSIMSLAYESLFYLIYCILLFIYIQIEQNDLGRLWSDLRHNTKKSDSVVFGPFTLVEFKRALFILALIEIAFFGTGNLSSLNSFNPSFIRNFISTFSPFLMTALLVLKIVMPFFILCCTFCLILQADRKQLPERVSVLLFILTDLMANFFFYCLKDDGSWLEIGISISNYVICMLTAAIFFILFHISNKIWTIKLLNLYRSETLDDNKAL